MFEHLGIEDQKRFKRHLLLSQVGVEGQQKIKNSKVLVIGAGGLGCPVLLELAAAGVGTIGIMDYDTVDISNLQRQILYTEKDLGQPKVQVAKQRLIRMNSDLNVRCIEDRLETSNAVQILEKYDIIVDATDNFETRYLISDTCVQLNKPNIYGAIYEFYGQVTVFGNQGPCLRCLSPIPPKEGEMIDPRHAGVLGAVPGIVGSLQAAEVLKQILGCGTSLKGRMIFLDVLHMKFDEMALPQNPKCPICGKGAKNEQ